MDWQAILDVALSDGVNAKRVDFMSNALIQLIPDQPSKKADAEWLKERGWQCVKYEPFTMHSPVNRDLTFYDGWVFMPDAEFGVEASRMYVALVEAAMEAMKHGE